MKILFDRQKTVFLVDGSSFLYRAYYGVRPMHTSAGLPVHAVYSFCRMIKKLIDQHNPHYIALVWDSKGKTQRHEIYQEYKAQREAPPSDLFDQKQLIQEFANLITIKQVEQPGYEADDLMYSITQDLVQKNYQVVLITSDKDMGQLLSDNVSIFDTFKDIVIDRASFEEKMGFEVAKLPFYFALLGDTSDNIPGVRGIGEKGARELVRQFSSLDDLYNNLDTVPKERTRTALEQSRDNAFLSLKLFLLRYSPTNLTSDDFVFNEHDWVKAQPLFERLEFKSLLKDLQKYGVTLQEKVWLSKEKGYTFSSITSREELARICALIKEKKIVALDTELTGLDLFTEQVIGISVAVEKGTAYYIPFGHITIEPQLTVRDVKEFLGPLLADASIPKIMHNAKFDQLALSVNLGMPVRGLIFDTLVAASLVTEDWQRAGLKYISKYYLNEDMLSFDDVVKDKGYKNFAQVPLDLATEYGAADAHQTLQLWPIMHQELVRQQMISLYQDIEFPLINVLYKMEQRGIICDTRILQELDAEVSRDITSVREEIISLIGEEYKNINLNSPKQLESLLFIHLQLPPQKKSGKGTGYSTDQEVLEELAKMHPVPALIVRYRGLYKLKSTYIDALPSYVKPSTGRIHTTYSQTRVATGRLASLDPNLQNIPTDSSGYHLHIRSAFKPEPGHLFISADYSQIELRVLAYLSQDENLRTAFERGLDIHTQTAAGLFGIPHAQVTHQQRQIGKRINFSILYGLTPFGLSKDLNIPLADAKRYIDAYFAQYPGVLTWMESVVEVTKQQGYVTTHWGRRRDIPGIYEKNKNLYELAKRVAINTVAQGTAAEIMKMGMISLDHLVEEQQINAHILLQIHDELIISADKTQKDTVSSLMKKTLENVVHWNIPLVVDVRTGDNWQEITK